jgi:signal peptidase I
MEWLVGLDVRMVLILVGALLIVRAGILRLRKASHSPGAYSSACARSSSLLTSTLTECSEIAIVSLVVVFLVLHRFLFQLFYIPSESMLPTLAVQDHILVNKWIYRIQPPRRGDVVVFRAPRAASDAPKDYIKRIIGLPGETVSVTPDRIYLDGRPLVPIILMSEADSTRGLLVGDHDRVQVEADRVLVNGKPVLRVSQSGSARQVGSSLLVDGRVVGAVAPGETLRCRPIRPDRDGIDAEGCVLSGKDRSRLTVVKGRRLSLRTGGVTVNGQPLPESYLREAPRYAMAPVRLATGQFLVLGDNRNNSKDGHVWGALDGALIQGRAEAIYWPIGRARWFGQSDEAPQPGSWLASTRRPAASQL